MLLSMDGRNPTFEARCLGPWGTIFGCVLVTSRLCNQRDDLHTIFSISDALRRYTHHNVNPNYHPNPHTITCSEPYFDIHRCPYAPAYLDLHAKCLSAV